MEFHTFGKKQNSAVVLILGMLTPWQIWKKAIAYFSKDHYVIVPELDSHTEDTKSQFLSAETEAKLIQEYLIKENKNRLYALCGLSMGGRIAALLAGMEKISTQYLILDGAPLKKLPSFLIGFMKKNYVKIIRKTQARDPKVIADCKRNFLPEQLHPYFFKIADRMEPESIQLIIDSVFSAFEYKAYDRNTKILFMHGTGMNEFVSKKSAEMLKKENPQTVMQCFHGYAHAQLACFMPEQWVKTVSQFMMQS